jgi:hypothetical protein
METLELDVIIVYPEVEVIKEHILLCTTLV